MRNGHFSTAVELRTRRARHVFAALGIVLALPIRPAMAGTPSVSSGHTDLREQDVPALAPVSPSEPIIGRIEIPRVGVSAMILEGVDDRTIRLAVGHFPETPLPFETGNMALAAHRTTEFHGLRSIRPGDEVSIVSSQGTFRYKVEKTWVVPPEDVSVLDPSPEKVLTLVTCFPFDYQGPAPERFIVRARSLDPREPPGFDGGVILLPPIDPKPTN